VRADLSAAGTIEVEKLPQVTYVKWPLKSHAGETLSLFRIAPDGSSVQRVGVVLGKASDDAVEISGGLIPGDQIIVSDTSAWNSYDHLQLK
jgi:HlyD family secretion protein